VCAPNLQERFDLTFQIYANLQLEMRRAVVGERVDPCTPLGNVGRQYEIGDRDGLSLAITGKNLVQRLASSMPEPVEERGLDCKPRGRASNRVRREHLAQQLEGTSERVRADWLIRHPVELFGRFVDRIRGIARKWRRFADPRGPVAPHQRQHPKSTSSKPTGCANERRRQVSFEELDSRVQLGQSAIPMARRIP